MPGPATAPHRGASTAGGPWRTRLAELIWYRSFTGATGPFLEAARSDRCLSYGELRRSADRWSSLLDDLEIAPGGTVGLAVEDPLDFAAAFLGVIAAGRVAGPLDPRATDHELAAACTRLRPALVVSDRRPPADDQAEWLTLPAGTYRLGDPAADGRAPSATVSTGEGVPALPSWPEPGDAGVVLCTSGTTGAPKRIRLGEARLLHTAAAVAAHHRLTVADRGFNPLPLFHINAEVVGLLATLSAGATLVLDDRFHRTGFWDTVARHHVTWINAVPAILARLVPLAEGERVPPGIRFARSASAPLPAAVLERFEETTGVAVVETYGMTEAASQITANPVDGGRRPGSVGRPVGTEVRVQAEPGTVGPVLIRGPGVITAYDGPGYEDRIDTEGWLDSGDVGFMDDGWLYLVGRRDDVINCGGEKLYPREVEEVMLADTGVTAAVVVGEAHHQLGQVPIAFVVPASGGRDRSEVEALVRRLEERCARVLSKPKRPVAYHAIARLPEGLNGKVQRHAIGGEPTIYTLVVR